MYFYFNDERPVALKINGELFGMANGERCFNFDDTTPLVEICPLCADEAPSFFYPNDDFLSSPPAGFAVTDMRGGYYVLKTYGKTQTPFTLLAQKKFSDAIITVFTENGLTVSIETPHDTFAETLYLDAVSAQILRERINGADFIFISFNKKASDKKILCAYSASPVKRVFMREVDNFEIIGGALVTTELFCDVAKHEIKTVWNATGELKEVSRETTCSKNFSADRVCDLILPYVFAEEFLTNGDFLRYLGGDVKKNADKLGGFFGEFIGVCVPPFFRDYNEIGFIKKRGENAYYIDYFIFETENGKISGIKKTT